MKFRFSRKQLCIPYAAFLIIFVIAPLLVVIYYAFTNGEGVYLYDMDGTKYLDFVSGIAAMQPSAEAVEVVVSALVCVVL